MKNKFPLVEVLWTDASHYADHTVGLAGAQQMSGALARTMGYLLGNNKERVVLAMTHFHDIELPQEDITTEGGFRVIWVIPKGCVKSIRVLER